MSLQRRIGLVFFILSLITLVANSIKINSDIELFYIATFILYVSAFGYSAIVDSQASKLLQIFSFLIASGLSLMFNENLMFGTAILIVEIFVLYAYDFYENNLFIKIIGTFFSLAVIIFITISPFDVAIMWFIFTNFIIATIFMILYEKLERAYNAITKSEGITARAMDLVERINHGTKNKR